MLFRFDEEEKAIIREFEAKAKAAGITPEKYSREIADVTKEADELIIKYEPRQQNQGEKLAAEFELQMQKIEAEHFKKLTTPTKIIEDGKQKTEDALIFYYNYLSKDLEGIQENFSRKPIFSMRLPGYKQYFSWIIKHSADELFKLVQESDQDSLFLWEPKELSDDLKEKVLNEHYKRLIGTPGEEKLDKIVNECLFNTKYVDLTPAASKANSKPMVLDKNLDVAMANTLIINGINTLNATELKLLRMAIMQSKIGDTRFFEYEISAKEIAGFLNLDLDNLYKNLDKMTDNIQAAFIKLKDDRTQQFKKYGWVSHCFYVNGLVSIKLNDDLKPYILGLKRCFFKYKIEELISYKSKHTIILRELLAAKMGSEKPHADVVIEIPISLEELKHVTNTDKEYKSTSLFKTRVLDTAIQEINEYSLMYHITATPYKNGRSIAGYTFTIESDTHYQKYNKTQKRAIDVIPANKTRKPKTCKKEQAMQLTLEEVFNQEF